MNCDKAEKIVAALSAEEKAALLTGKDVFSTCDLPAYGVPSVRFSDGPNGVRLTDRANCYPSACAIACSFSRETAEALGELIGREFSAEGVDLMLGPGMNLKRDPLCGRNFEYYSEDPCLSGELAAAFVIGAQRHVGCCVKHFAANNRENKRMTLDVRVSDRALFETYLSSFRRVVKQAHPKAIMSSYNKINGVYAGEDSRLLTDILRKKWGFDGIVISDWGAVNDKIASVKAGMNLEMPANPANTERLLEAQNRGEIAAEAIDERARECVSFALSFDGERAGCDREESLGRAAALAADCAVLLKNDGVLPLDLCRTVLVTGEGAFSPRIQGGGCAAVNPDRVLSPVEELKKQLPETEIIAARGEDALTYADRADAVVCYLQIPAEEESEGYDRADFRLPDSEIERIKRLYRANPNLVVVLAGGGMVDTSWDGHCGALLATYLMGGGFGRAVSLLLSGKVNPSGRLAETWLNRLEDASCRPFSGGEETEIYGEDLFVGYKYYNAKKVAVKYPFGYGLSYTAFDYRNIAIGRDSVSFDLGNTGTRGGAEVVQVYVGYRGKAVRPEAELKAFEKVYLNAGETRRVTISLTEEAYETFDPAVGDLAVCGGEYVISLRKDAAHTIAEAAVTLSETRPRQFDENSPVGALLSTERGKHIVERELKPYLALAITGNFNADIEMKDGQAVNNPMFNAVMRDLPLRALYNLTAGRFDRDRLNAILKILNGGNGK